MDGRGSDQSSFLRRMESGRRSPGSRGFSAFRTLFSLVDDRRSGSGICDRETISAHASRLCEYLSLRDMGRRKRTRRYPYEYLFARREDSFSDHELIAPEGCAVITCGIDVQDDRLEIELWHGEKDKPLPRIGRSTLGFCTAIRVAKLWEELDALLCDLGPFRTGDRSPSLRLALIREVITQARSTLLSKVVRVVGSMRSKIEEKREDLRSQIDRVGIILGKFRFTSSEASRSRNR